MEHPFTDIAAVSASTLDTLNDRGEVDLARAYSWALAANLVLNAGWSWIFFNRRRLGPAAVAAAALTVEQCRPGTPGGRGEHSCGRRSGAYPLWCGFATLLSTRIWQLNR